MKINFGESVNQLRVNSNFWRKVVNFGDPYHFSLGWPLYAVSNLPRNLGMVNFLAMPV